MSSDLKDCIPIRYVLAILGCIGLGTLSAVRDCVKLKKLNDKWNTEDIDSFMGYYFLGYLICQLPGGRMSEIFSAKAVLFSAVFLNSVCSVVTPLLSHKKGLILILRVLEGIGGGISHPAMHSMIARWSPPSDRAILCSISYGWENLISVILLLVGESQNRWNIRFFILGGVGGVWLILWLIFAADTPNGHRFVGEKEKDLINSSLNIDIKNESLTKNILFPWNGCWKSYGFLAIFTAHLCTNYSLYIYYTMEKVPMTPSVLEIEICRHKSITVMPYILMGIFSTWLSIHLRVAESKEKFSRTKSRKVATLVGILTSTICFIISLATEFHPILIVSISSTGAFYSGFYINHIDIAPHFAGTLLAVTDSVANVGNIFLAYLVLNTNLSNFIVLTTLMAFLIAALFFVIFGTAEMEDWYKDYFEIRENNEQISLNRDVSRQIEIFTINVQ